MSVDYGKVAVLGLGVTGQSVVRFLQARGHAPEVLDTRSAEALDLSALPDLPVQAGVTSLASLKVDTLVVSPGISWDSCLVRSIPGHVRVLSDIDLFFDAVTQPVIGITGTNGKSTVTSLVGHLLQQSGLDYRVGGNLGQAALDLVDEQAEGYVLELSSFQLERTTSMRFAAATILNISEDHLDKHGSLSAYIDAKQRIYTRCDLAVAKRDDEATLPVQPTGSLVTFALTAPGSDTQWGLCQRDQVTWLCRGADLLIKAADLPLAGAHNIENVLAACALVRPWLNLKQMAAALHSFSGLAHRFETVAQGHGIEAINDSKATNVGAAVSALQGFTPLGQVVLVGGGDAKGADLAPYVKAMQGRVKLLVAVGQDGAALTDLACAQGIDARYFTDFSDAVTAGFNACSAGDTLLLSPGCASIDMFDSFKARGDAFTQLVIQLMQQEANS